MPNSLDADLVLKLKNVDQVLNQLKSKLSNVGMQNLGNIKISPTATKELLNLVRAVGAAKPAFVEAATSLNILGTSLSKIAGSLKGAAPALNAYTNFLKTATRAQHDYSNAQSRATNLSEEFGRQTGIIARRFGGFLLAREVISKVGLAFKEATDQAIGFEREIIRVAQFQNTTIQQASQLGDFVSDLATKFGASSSSLIKSVQILAQAGRSTGEIKSIVSALAPATLTASFSDLGKATESFNALLGQFNIKASDSTQALDELNAIAEAFNVSIDELFEGLKRSGSSFAALAGVKEGVTPGTQALREYAAVFTAVIDTTREGADTIGTALKTILPRLQRGKTQDVLRGFGIELLTDDKKFVGPLEAIKRISEGLKGISAQSPVFSKVVEELGGSRQYNRALPLFQETAKIQRAIDIASNASGSVAADAELAQQSLEIQIAKTLERFRELLRELTQTTAFKALAASILGIANAAITLADSLKELVPLLAAITTVQLLKNVPPFSQGFSKGIGFSLRKNSGGMVPSLLTPGELVFSPNAVKREGISKLNQFNQTGRASFRSLGGTFTVPGTGNSDSVRMDLPEGSFVVKKSSVEKARQGFEMGGYASRKRFIGGGVLPPARDFGQFKDVSPRIANVFDKVGKEFIKSARQIGASFDDIKVAFFQSAKSAPDINTLSRNLENRLDIFRTEADKGGRSQTLEDKQLARQKAEAAVERVARRAAEKGIELSATGRDRARSFFEEDVRDIGKPKVTAKAARVERARQERIFNETFEELAKTVPVSLSADSISQSRSGRLARAFSQPISDKTFGRIQTSSLGIGIAGGLLSSSEGKAGQVAGGALTGAAIGLQSSLLTANPLIIALATLGGAAQGAAAAVQNFAKKTQDAVDSKAVTDFLAGRSKVSDVSRALSASAAFDATFKETDIEKGVLGNAFLNANLTRKSDKEAFGRAGLITQLSSIFTGGGFGGAISSLTPAEIARSQKEEALAGLRNRFSGASERQSDLLKTAVENKIRTGVPIDREALVAQFTKDQDVAKLLALQSKALKDPTKLQDSVATKVLAGDVIRQIINSTEEANKSFSDLSKTLRALTSSSFAMEEAFNNINVALIGVKDVVSQFDRDIEQSLTLASNSPALSNKTRANVFASEFGQAPLNFDKEISLLTKTLNIDPNQNKGFLAVGQAASLANFAKTALPAQLLAASSSSRADATVGDFLKNTIKSTGVGELDKFIRDSIEANFGGEKDITLAGINQEDINKVSTIFSDAVGGVAKQILSDTQNAANDNIVRRNQQALSVASANQNIAQQSIGINQLGAQRGVVRAEILGRRSPLADPARALGLQNQDISAILGRPNQGIGDIVNRLNAINQAGVDSSNVDEFTRLTEALKLLSKDTRVLDATMQKVNEFNQAQQGATNLFERLLGGGVDERVKFNQQLRDFQSIAAGGNVGGPRTIEALRTIEQLMEGLTPEQFQAQTGISKDDAEQRLRDIRAEQGRRQFGNGPLADILAGNVRGEGRAPLAQQADDAIKGMRAASEILRAQSEANLQTAIKQMADQQQAFSFGIQQAFEQAFSSNGSLELQRTLNNFSQIFGGEGGAKLEVRGQTDVVVSFNNINGVIGGIQEDLKVFVTNIVTESINRALKQGGGIAGANQP